ncbi:MAG: polysaccharide export protein [Verrucomicrobiota bacterium]|nr:polysaccharide export protein [Verrucomicrobiota bacterium]
MKVSWKRSALEFSLGLFFTAGLFTGCASDSNGPVFHDNPQPPAGVGSATGSVGSVAADADRLRAGETVTVDFSGLSAADLQSMPESKQTIQEDGTISLPFIGNVVAAGKTPGQLQNDIYNDYVPKYYLHLTVTVQSEDRVFYVGGQVKQPGREVYAGQITVTKAIQAAGDFTDYANRRKVKLIRANGQVITVNCEKALRDPALDPAVYPGDQIQVPRRIW